MVYGNVGGWSAQVVKLRIIELQLRCFFPVILVLRTAAIKGARENLLRFINVSLLYTKINSHNLVTKTTSRS